MTFSKEARMGSIKGLGVIALFAVASIFFSEIPVAKLMGLSPLVIAIALGIFVGNTFRHRFPASWNLGIRYATKQVLRLAIILYGFRITFQEIYQVGMPGLFIDLFTIISITFLSFWAGKKLFKVDRDTSLLIGTGSAICGAAAVLATEGVLKSEPHKATTAVATVVLFGTISIFLYPLLQHLVFFFDDTQFGIFVGGTVHEVGQVIAIGNSVSPSAEGTALIVKMTRVMLLAPFLTLLGLFIRRGEGRAKIKEAIPWFAVGFILVSGFNSLGLLSHKTLFYVNFIDTMLLAMAMTAIGMETNFKKIRQTGLKPLYLASVLYIWLIVSGALFTKWIHASN